MQTAVETLRWKDVHIQVQDSRLIEQLEETTDASHLKQLNGKINRMLSK